MTDNKTEKKETQRKQCPLDKDLECSRCRFYEMTDRMIERCVLFAIRDSLDLIKLRGEEK